MFPRHRRFNREATLNDAISGYLFLIICHAISLDVRLTVSAAATGGSSAPSFPSSPSPLPSPLSESIFSVVKTKLGPVRGVVVKDNNGVRTTRFHAIPYARPPVGELRFRAPVKHTGWEFDGNGPLDATRSSADCPSASAVGGGTAGSRDYGSIEEEDCLRLDVLIPGDVSTVTRVSGRDLLPVLVVISDDDTSEYLNGRPGGGGGTGGVERASSSLGNVLPRLADSGQMIIVNVKHRTGALGYLSIFPSSSSSAFSSSTEDVVKPELNVGLQDQRLAMHWVWDNINAFGGNPDRITLFGDSISVGLHAVSSQSLFTRAILHGGSFPISPGVMIGSEENIEQLSSSTNSFILPSSVSLTMQLAKNFDCDVSNTLSCLQNISLPSLLGKVGSIERQFSSSTLWAREYPRRSIWRPVVDGDDFADHALRLLAKGSSHVADYMIGTSVMNNNCKNPKVLAYEDISQKLQASILTAFSGECSSTAQNKELNYNKLCSEKGVRSAVSAVLLEYGISADDEATSDILDSFFADAFSLAPAELFARLLSRFDRPVYAYVSYHTGAASCTSSGFGPSDSGSGGGTGADTRRTGEVRDQAMSAQLLLRQQQEQKRQLELLWSAWINFIKTGNPSSPAAANDSKGTDWQRFTELNRYYAVFGGREGGGEGGGEGVGSSNVSTVRQLSDAGSRRRMAFWNDYFPYLLKDGVSGRDRDDYSFKHPGRLGSAELRFTENLPPIVWALIAVVAILLLIILLLVIKIYQSRSSAPSSIASSISSSTRGSNGNHHQLSQALDSSYKSSSSQSSLGCCSCCWTPGRKSVYNSSYALETRTLKHLPYYDET